MRADQTSYTLATNLAATGAAVAIKGGNYLFSAEGTVGGSTISLQTQSPNGTWADLSAVGGSAIVKSTVLPFAASQIYLPPGNVRVAMTGGSPSGVYAYLTGIG